MNNTGTYLREKMKEALIEWNESGDASQCGKILERAINARLLRTGLCEVHGRILPYSVDDSPWRCHCGRDVSDQRVMSEEEFQELRNGDPTA